MCVLGGVMCVWFGIAVGEIRVLAFRGDNVPKQKTLDDALILADVGPALELWSGPIREEMRGGRRSTRGRWRGGGVRGADGICSLLGLGPGLNG